MSKYRKIVSNNNEYLNNIFTPENLQPSITLINGTTEVKFDDYDVYIKFVNTSAECFLTCVDFNYIDHILLDGVKYYENDVIKLWEDLGKNPNNYLTGRIVFPFETDNEEHIAAFKFKNVQSDTWLRIDGGWSSTNISEMVILRYVYNLTREYRGHTNIIYYLNNYLGDISDKETLETLFNKWTSRTNYQVYFPKDVKYIPGYLSYNLQLDAFKNLYELKDLEEIGQYNFTNLSSENSPLNIDLSNLTKLKTIGQYSFTGYVDYNTSDKTSTEVDSLILPPNIETLCTRTFGFHYNNVIIEIPKSMKNMEGSFNKVNISGTLTLKFKSAIPPQISSFYYTVLGTNNDINISIMVPRGSKADYLVAMTGLDSYYPTKEAMLEYYEEYKPSLLARIIEYDPE